MSSSVTTVARSSDFQRAFVAMRYFFGARGEALLQPLSTLGVAPAASDVGSGLCKSERGDRAKTLAAELGRLAAALETQGIVR